MSATVTDALRDIARLKFPLCNKLSRKNDILPFEDSSQLESLCEKSDCSLFVMGSHNKKRPNNLIFGRTFDFKALDLIELGILKYEPMSTDATKTNVVGSKPCILFQGNEFVQNDTMSKIKNYFLDFFRAEQVNKVDFFGLDHVVVLSTTQERILFRHYHVKHIADPASKVPRVELENIGPSLDLEIRRTRFADAELWKQACWKPQALIKSNKDEKKNISRNVFGDKIGRIHMEHQDLKKIALHKTRARKSKL